MLARERVFVDLFLILLHRIGTTHPTHYHVVYDELNSKLDDVQELVHALSCVYQTSTRAISIVALIQYAQLAATQMSWFIIPATKVSDAQLPRFHPSISKILFFC